MLFLKVPVFGRDRNKDMSRQAETIMENDIVDKVTRLSKIGFSIKRFTTDFS